MSERQRIVGIMPAAGFGSRLSPLPFSKELMPIGMGIIGEDTVAKPKTVSHYLLERLVLGGVTHIYIVMRKGKWDIPSYYGDGSFLPAHVAYLVTDGTPGHPYTVDCAFPFVDGDLVAFGYPDILFEPHDAFSKLVQCQQTQGSDLVLGAFPLAPEQSWDVLEFEKGVVRKVSSEGPARGADIRWGWGIAVWTPRFSLFMHNYLSDLLASAQAPVAEIVLDQVFQAAIDAGLQVDHVSFENGYLLDVGTPENLLIAQRKALSADH